MLYNQDIPRICTALAEWGACMVYLYLIKREKLRRPSFWYISLAVMAVQIAFLELTGDLPVAFWLTCMAIAVAIMYVFLLMGGELSALGAGYCGARAFLLAEFAASLEWQVFAFMRSIGYGSVWIQVIFVIIIYGGCFWIAAYLERPSLTDDYLNQLTIREVLAAAGIAAAIFAFSNLSYLYSNLPFTSSRMADIFSIRTLVDFGGIAVLFAYQSRICDYMAERELAAMNAVLKSQYDQYRNYQDSLDLIHIKYHDLKHQIAALRMETDEQKRRKWLDAMEEEVSAFAYQSRICDYMAERELAAMNAVLKSQYDQYRNYQDSLDLIHIKYHDLKHQIAALRMETDEQKRRKWLDAMEEEVSAFGTLNKTGNQVLDTILAAKLFHCRKNKIQITCVVDGKLLDFIHVMDICSIFGNALDNAIEHVILIPEEEKRLIHMSVSAKKNFVFIKIENYCESEIIKNQHSLITTTKADKQNHGFGLRSICAAAEKYGGSVSFEQVQNWFELKILLPRG